MINFVLIRDINIYERKKYWIYSDESWVVSNILNNEGNVQSSQYLGHSKLIKVRGLKH